MPNLRCVHWQGGTSCDLGEKCKCFETVETGSIQGSEAPSQQEPTVAEIPVPQRVQIHDSERGLLIVQTDDQGDVYLNIGSVFDKGLRFCTVVGGGIRHTRTRKALIELKAAMHADNQEFEVPTEQTAEVSLTSTPPESEAKLIGLLEAVTATLAAAAKVRAGEVKELAEALDKAVAFGIAPAIQDEMLAILAKYSLAKTEEKP